MEHFRLEELSATTALQANTLELVPGQEAFVTPVTYEQADSSLDHSKTWGGSSSPATRSQASSALILIARIRNQNCAAVSGGSVLQRPGRARAWVGLPSRQRRKKPPLWATTRSRRCGQATNQDRASSSTNSDLSTQASPNTATKLEPFTFSERNAAHPCGRARHQRPVLPSPLPRL